MKSDHTACYSKPSTASYSTWNKTQFLKIDYEDLQDTVATNLCNPVDHSQTHFPPHWPSLSQAHQAHACLCSFSFAVCSSRTLCPQRFCLAQFFTLKSPSSSLLIIIWPLSLKRPHHPLPVHAHILPCFIFLIASVIIWDYISESFLHHLSLPEKKYNLSDAENMLIVFPVSRCMYIMSINKQTQNKCCRRWLLTPAALLQWCPNVSLF